MCDAVKMDGLRVTKLTFSGVLYFKFLTLNL